MRHLSERQLAKAVEGHPSQAATAHIQICKYCREIVEDAKETLEKFDRGELENEPIPREWIENALRRAEQEWSKRRDKP